MKTKDVERRWSFSPSHQIILALFKVGHGLAEEDNYSMIIPIMMILMIRMIKDNNNQWLIGQKMHIKCKNSLRTSIKEIVAVTMGKGVKQISVS